MSTPLPYLIQQIKTHYGLSKDLERLVIKIRKDYAKEKTENLKATIEAQKQYMITALSEVRNVQIKMIVLEDILKVRTEIKRTGSWRDTE